MKGLGKVISCFCLVTVVFILYVHERVEMLRLSYRIYHKSAQVSRQGEAYRQLKFEVAQMRSPESLEKRLGELPLPLTLPKEIKVLKVPQETVPLQQREPLAVPVPTHSLFHFLGQWVQVAQARTSDP